MTRGDAARDARAADGDAALGMLDEIREKVDFVIENTSICEVDPKGVRLLRDILTTWRHDLEEENSADAPQQ